MQRCAGPGCIRLTDDPTGEGWLGRFQQYPKGYIATRKYFCSRRCFDKYMAHFKAPIKAGKL